MKVFSIWDTIHQKIIHKILLCLKNGKIEENEQEQKIRYALSSILGELEKCLILGLCFWLLGALKIFFLSLCSVVMLRIFMGGQHRNTMLGCFLQSFFTFAIIYILGFHINILQGCYVVYMTTIVIIWYCTPVLSEKRIAYSNFMQMKFKAKLVLEVLKGEKDINTIATENNIQPNLLRNWKKEFLDNASVVFDDKREENIKEKLASERKEKAEPELFMITCLFTKSTALAVEATLDASPYQQIF